MAFGRHCCGAGDFVGLFTAMFLHGGWAHLGANSAFILVWRRASGPLDRSRGTCGALAFFGFFLVCGVIGNLGFALINPSEQAALIGASGAGAGLMGAASRLMTRGPGLASFRSQSVVSMAASWLVINLIIAVVGWAPGSGGAPVAWQAHLAGYAAVCAADWPGVAGLKAGVSPSHLRYLHSGSFWGTLAANE